MQHSSATQSLHLSFWGLRKIVACSHSSSQCLLVATVFGTVSSLHPTSFLMIFILVIYYYIYIVPPCKQSKSKICTISRPRPHAEDGLQDDPQVLQLARDHTRPSSMSGEAM